MTWKEKLEEIADGWKGVIWLSPKMKEIAEKRAEVCAKCDSNKLGVCSECGCPLFAKTKSSKESTDCDLNKWSEIERP